MLTTWIGLKLIMLSEKKSILKDLLYNSLKVTKLQRSRANYRLLGLERVEGTNIGGGTPEGDVWNAGIVLYLDHGGGYTDLHM